VASRPGGEILAKRKPTASTLKTNWVLAYDRVLTELLPYLDNPEDFASFEPTLTLRMRRGSFSMLEEARSSIKDHDVRWNLAFPKKEIHQTHFSLYLSVLKIWWPCHSKL
jgi:hypothetical protein